jgi:hypothetical protein
MDRDDQDVPVPRATESGPPMQWNRIETVRAGLWRQFVLTGDGFLHEILVRADVRSGARVDVRHSLTFSVRVDGTMLPGRYAARDDAFAAGHAWLGTT